MVIVEIFWIARDQFGASRPRSAASLPRRAKAFARAPRCDGLERREYWISKNVAERQGVVRKSRFSNTGERQNLNSARQPKPDCSPRNPMKTNDRPIFVPSRKRRYCTKNVHSPRIFRSQATNHEFRSMALVIATSVAAEILVTHCKQAIATPSDRYTSSSSQRAREGLFLSPDPAQAAFRPHRNLFAALGLKV
jgi:hypothetical protein